MRTIVLMYMPGHAGNFVLRLLGLSPKTMPILEKQKLEQMVHEHLPIVNFDRLEHYKFSTSTKKYKDWQKFHRSYADYLDSALYRALNLISQLKYDFIYAMHPHEINKNFLEVDFTEYYYIDLDTKYNSWVDREQKKLNFYWREHEEQQFDHYKSLYHMQPISLTEMLDSEQQFVAEYLRICNQIQLDPMVDEAIKLRDDWLSIRFGQD